MQTPLFVVMKLIPSLPIVEALEQLYSNKIITDKEYEHLSLGICGVRTYGDFIVVLHREELSEIDKKQIDVWKKTLK